jgi:sec-independent protein translocase protein TatA
MSGGELVLVVLAVLILFGARKIPEFAKGLGQGIKEFKKASSAEEAPTTSNNNSNSNKPTTPAA